MINNLDLNLEQIYYDLECLDDDENPFVPILYNYNKFQLISTVMTIKDYKDNELDLKFSDEDMFFENMASIEDKIFEDIDLYSNEWFGIDSKIIPDELINHYIKPIITYNKFSNGDYDYDSIPRLKLKLSDDLEIYNLNDELVYCNDDLNLNNIFKENNKLIFILQINGISYSNRLFSLDLEIKQIKLDYNISYYNNSLIILNQYQYYELENNNSNFNNEYLPNSSDEEENDNDELSDNSDDLYSNFLNDKFIDDEEGSDNEQDDGIEDEEEQENEEEQQDSENEEEREQEEGSENEEQKEQENENK